jgi:hypothetical protein
LSRECPVATKIKSRKASMKSGRKRGSTAKRGMKASGRSVTKVRVTTRRSPVARPKQSPVARVKRVTREVVQQASVAVTAGVATLRDLGGELVERVRG